MGKNQLRGARGTIRSTHLLSVFLNSWKERCKKTKSTSGNPHAPLKKQNRPCPASRGRGDKQGYHPHHGPGCQGLPRAWSWASRHHGGSLALRTALKCSAITESCLQPGAGPARPRLSRHQVKSEPLCGDCSFRPVSSERLFLNHLCLVKFIS